MNDLKISLEKKLEGMHYGSRILLPFKVHVLKATIEKDIITDFSKSDRNACYNITDDFTEIYFHNYKDIEDTLTKYETIKLVVVEQGKNIFNFSNHIKIGLHVKENHKLEIEQLDGDVLFVE